MYDEELFLERYNADNWDIWSQLDEVLWLWKDTYREYWGIDRRSPPGGLTEAQWKDAKISDKLAAAFLKWGLALSLFPSSASAPEQPISTTKLKEFRTALREHAKLPIVRDRVGLELATDAVKQLAGSTRRALRLLGIVQGRQLSERASMYVASAGRVQRVTLVGQSERQGPKIGTASRWR